MALLNKATADTRTAGAPTGSDAVGVGNPDEGQADTLEVIRHEPLYRQLPAWNGDRAPGAGVEASDLSLPQAQQADTPYGPREDLGIVSAPGEDDPHRWTRSKPLIAGAAVVLIVGAAAGIGFGLSGGSDPARFSQTFAPESYPASGVTVTRTWSLTGGDHPTLHGELAFTTTRAVATTVEEVIPKSLADDVQKIIFKPQPKVVQRDPVVAYDLPAQAGLTVLGTYDIPVRADQVSQAALNTWVKDQRNEAGARYRQAHRLARMAFEPAALTVGVGQTKRVRLTGVMEDGKVAPTVALSGAGYEVGDANVAVVTDDGTVRGLTKGRTSIRARLGSLTADGSLTVTATATTTPTTGASNGRSTPGRDTGGSKDATRSNGATKGRSSADSGGRDAATTSGSGRPSRGSGPRGGVSSGAKPTSGGTTNPPSSNPGTRPPSSNPVTQPPSSNPVTQPPTSDPVTQPPTSDPGTQPPTSDPGTQPPTSDPGTQPPTTDPGTQPPVIDPGTQPPMTDPVTQPPSSDPGTQPPVTDPGTQPPVTDPGTQPPVTDPGTAPPIIDPLP